MAGADPAGIESSELDEDGPVLFRDVENLAAGASSAATEKEQMELGFDRNEASSSQHRAPEKPKRERIIVIYLQAAAGRVISGHKIASAMKTVGMQFGDMGVFNHYGVGKMRAEQPLFSAANMFEPGEIDFDALKDFETRGLAVFMRLPSAIDGLVAFELMLNTAQRLAELLPAELYDDDHQLLDSDTIEQLRETVGSFEHEYA